MPAYNDITCLYRKIVDVIENNSVSTKYTYFDDSNSTYEIEIKNDNNSQVMILKVINIEGCMFSFTVLKNRSIGVSSNHISLIKDCPEYISIYNSKVNGTVNCNITELPTVIRDGDLFQYSTLMSNEEFEGYKFYLGLDIDKYDFIIYISSAIDYNIFHVMLEGNDDKLG